MVTVRLSTQADSAVGEVSATPTSLCNPTYYVVVGFFEGTIKVPLLVCVIQKVEHYTLNQSRP